MENVAQGQAVLTLNAGEQSAFAVASGTVSVQGLTRRVQKGRTLSPFSRVSTYGDSSP